MELPNRDQARYLIQEACLFLVFSYLILIGGTFNGLVLTRLNLINLGLVIILGMILIFYRIIRHKSGVLTGLDLGVVLILVAGIISTIFSVDSRRSIIGLIILFVAIIIYYVFIDLIKNGLPPTLINKVLILVSGFVLFFGIWELVSWYGSWLNITGMEELIPQATYRVRAFLGHPNFLAAYLNLIIPLLLAAIVLAKTKMTRLGWIVWLFLALLLVFFTSSRGGWLGTFVAVSTFVFGVFISRWEQIKSIWGRLIKNKIVVSAVIVLMLIGLGGLAVLLKWQSNHPTHPSDWTNIFASRDYIWVVARDMFNADILTGNGIFTFGTEYLKTESVPPNLLLAHAHNYYINVAAEQGIVGLLALCVYGISLVLVFIKAWKHHQFLSRIELIGVTSALLGLAAHSLFETPQSLPVLLFIPAIFIAQIASGVDGKDLGRFGWIKNVLMIGLWVISVSFLVFDYYVVKIYETGLGYAADNQWQESSKYLGKAVELDPGNSLYQFQKGQALGQIALDVNGQLQDEVSLDAAIDSYKKGLEIEPDYSVNWMNLGILFNAQGDTDQAIELMGTAVKLSPKQPYFLMTLANLLESEGLDQQAADLYQEALALRSEWVNLEYFHEQPDRAKLLNEWLTENQKNEENQDQWRPIEDMVTDEKYHEALKLLKSESKFNDPQAYALMGRVYLKLNDFQNAENAYLKAIWMRPGSELLLAEIHFGLGSVYLAQDDAESALGAFLMAEDLINRTTSYGIGNLGETQYSWYIFYKNSIKQDMLPGMVVPVYIEGMAEGLSYLVDWYCNNGENGSAENAIDKLNQIQQVQLDSIPGINNTCNQ